MRFGIIFCGFGTLDLVAKSLAPWLALRKQGLCSICAVSVKFKDFDSEDDGTRDYLRNLLQQGEIDNLIDGPDNIPETTARGMAMHYLKDEHAIDAIWMVDSDEMYTLDEISRISQYVQNSPFIAWFRLCLKNYIFNTQTYLADPFTPPRIFRVKTGSYIVNSFSGDNDIIYTGTITRDLKPQEYLSNLTIPKEVAWIAHFTWLSDERSKKKVQYQTKRWGNACSFVWNEKENCLEFNPNLPKPAYIYEPI